MLPKQANMRVTLENNNYSFGVIKHRYFVPYDLPEEGIEGNFEGRLNNGDYIIRMNTHDITKWKVKKMISYLKQHQILTMEFRSKKAYRQEYIKNKNKNNIQNKNNSISCRQFRANKKNQSNNIQQKVHRVKIEQTWSKSCPHCKKLHLMTSTAAELKHCCGGGRFVQDHPLPLKPLAAEIVELLYRDLEYMSSASAIINNMFAMCASAVKNDHGGGWEKDMRGHHCVKINGHIQHFFTRAYNSTDPSGGLSYFMFDSPEAILKHGNNLNKHGDNTRPRSETINLDYVEIIKNVLQKTNPFAKALRSLGDQIKQNLHRSRHLKASIHGGVEHFEVASVSGFGHHGLRVGVEVDINTGQHNLIDLTSPTLEPIAYPLFFNEGENGWGISSKSIKYLPYLRSRILMPEKLDESTFLMLPSASNPEVLILCNRMQAMARLCQVYMVDMVSRNTDLVLHWIKNNQRLIIHRPQKPFITCSHNDGSDSDIETEDEVDISAEPETLNTEEDDNAVCLPSSFHGGRRHLRSCALAALVLLSELGRATGFLTLTCNTEWKEIKSQLLVGQTAFDRPDIVCPVFQKRKAALLQNLRNGVYFRGNVAYIMHVIEFQKRGLPHAHIVFRLDTHPPPTASDSELAKYCDELVTAEMPEPLTPNDNSTECMIQNKYIDLVKSKMIHHCAVAVNGCKKSADAQCKRHYSDTSPPVLETYFKNGYPVYRRRHDKDRRVVPHNREILLDWDGHANLEFVTSTKSVMYLYKYLYKGSKPVSI